MTMKERIVAGLLASGLALAMFAPSCDPRPLESREMMCAADVSQDLGIEWSWEEGATERLEEFGRLVEACIQK